MCSIYHLPYSWVMGKLQVGQVMSININSFIAEHTVTKKYAYITLHALFLPAISYSCKTCKFHFYFLSFLLCNPMLNIMKWKYQCSNCHDTYFNSIAGKKMQLLLFSVGFLSPLDRCIIRLVLKKTKHKNHMHLSGLLQIAQCIMHSSITTDLLYTLGSKMN